MVYRAQLAENSSGYIGCPNKTFVRGPYHIQGPNRGSSEGLSKTSSEGLNEGPSEGINQSSSEELNKGPSDGPNSSPRNDACQRSRCMHIYTYIYIYNIYICIYVPIHIGRRRPGAPGPGALGFRPGALGPGAQGPGPGPRAQGPGLAALGPRLGAWGLEPGAWGRPGTRAGCPGHPALAKATQHRMGLHLLNFPQRRQMGPNLCSAHG